MTTHLFVEGAGPSDSQRRNCRRAFQKFFEKAGIERKPRVVASGSRRAAFEDFCNGLSSSKGTSLPLLLVDSEDPVAPEHSPWQHLKARNGDQWDKPPNAQENQVFLMVQVMETWFLSDPGALAASFGKDFNNGPFKSWPSLEAIPKGDVLDVLKKATASCKKQYGKGDTSFEVLEKINPSKVETACPSAKTFLDHLRTL